MDWQPHKDKMLAHCLAMAKIDPAYAVWAAGQYEKLSHGTLTNLKAKVEQEIKRACAGTSPAR